MSAAAWSSLTRRHCIVLFVFLHVFLWDIIIYFQLGSTHITYDRQKILDIRTASFIPPPPSNIPKELLCTSVPAWITSPDIKRRRRRRDRKQKRGKRAGIYARLRSYPDSCASFFTETWLNHNIPDAAIELVGRTVFRADRTADSGKGKGGGVCIYM